MSKALTVTDQANIVKFLSKGQTKDKIYKKINKEPKLIDRYIDNVVGNIQLGSSQPAPNPVESPVPSQPPIIPIKVREAVQNRIVKVGIDKNDAVSALNLIESQFSHDLEIIPSELDLYNAAMKVLRYRTSLINKTEGGQEGVTIMTPTASAVQDDKKAEHSTPPNPHIFRPKG